MNNLYNNIALRALNQTKTLNPITYLCIRCFFESLSPKTLKDGLFKEMLTRKLLVRKEWSSRNYTLYKEKNESDFIYRDVLGLSPFGVVSESLIMRYISENDFFANKDYVYSYLLPESKKSYRNYQYYFNGYKKRNENITKSFEENKTQVALVLDLEKFYPSINKDKAKETILNQIKDKSDDNFNSLSNNIISSILESSTSGVPIGPDLSHLIAQVYLEEFDIKMNEKYSGKYFRYVDDIVVLCDSSTEDNIIQDLKVYLPNELNINESKTDRLSFEEWQLLNSSYDKESENFNDLLNFITAYISMHPTKIDDLEKELEKNQYNIPLRRIKKQSKSKNYMKFIDYLMSDNSWITTYEVYFTKTEYIIEKLTTLKKYYLKKFTILAEGIFSDENTAENRSNTQQLKFILNRLIYLCPLNELINLYEKIPNTSKFADSREVIYTLHSKDLINTIQFGGKVLQTVCELWKEYDFEKIVFEKDDFLKIKDINKVIDSIIILFLYQVIDFSIDNISEYLTDTNNEYLKVLIDEKYIPNKEYCDEYILEVYGLLKYKTLEKRMELLFTRFDNDESLQLAGLDLGIY